MDLSEKPELHECELDCNLRILRELPVFAGLPSELLRVLAYLCEREVFAPGQPVLEEGQPAETTVAVISGSLAIERDGEVLGRVARGKCAGGLALLGRFKWLYTLRAEMEAECLLLPRHKILPQLLAQPEMMATVTQGLIDAVIGWDRDRLENTPDEVGAGPGII